MRVKVMFLCTLIATGLLLYFFTHKTPQATNFNNNPQILGESIPQITQSPSPTTEQTVSTTPTPETKTPNEQTPSGTSHPSPSASTPTPLALTSAKPETTIAKAGTLNTLTYTNLSANTVYVIDLSVYDYDSFAIAWPKNVTLKWSTQQPTKISDLAQVPIDDDTLPTDTKRYSGILPKQSTSKIYLVGNSQISTLTISLISPSKATSTTYTTQAAAGVYNSNAGASYSTLPIVTRDSWGANPANWDGNSSADIDASSRLVWYPVYYKAARIVVHHTATAPDTSNPAAAVRAIYMYHAYIRDWGDIGYNFLIDQNGTIYQGKLGGDEAMGYHAFGSANQTSLAISLIGDFTSTTPSTATRSSLIALMAEKAAFYGFTLKFGDGSLGNWTNPTYTVFGHRGSYKWDSASSSWQINATACPGNAFYPQLSGIVQEAETYRQNNFAEIKQVVNEVNASFATQHDEGVIIVRYNVPDTTPASTIEGYLPKFSGITQYTIKGNTVTISLTSSTVVHPKYGDSEYLIPPMNWSGYYNEFRTYSPAFVLNGPEDRAKTLLKIFKLDPRVEAADVKNYYQILSNQ